MTHDDHPSDDRWIERVSGDTSRGDASELEQHLESCSECRLRVAQFEEVISSLRSTPPASAPLHPLAAILSRQAVAGERTAHRSIRSRLVRLAAATLVAALLFTVGYALGRGDSSAEGRSVVSRGTLARAPLPAPPLLVIEPATAGAGDLALAPWVRDSAVAGGSEPPATRDSL